MGHKVRKAYKAMKKEDVSKSERKEFRKREHRLIDQWKADGKKARRSADYDSLLEQDRKTYAQLKDAVRRENLDEGKDDDEDEDEDEDDDEDEGDGAAGATGADFFLSG